MRNSKKQTPMVSKKTEKKPYKKRLRSLKDVRVYLADLINETRAGKVEPGLSSKLGFLLNVLRGVITDSDLEQRIQRLEAEVNNGSGKDYE